ncbi:P-loop NTPase fold protein [Rhodobacter capsulatus]|uniref:P-loop NTPase fold protein n=1 Tax=Rhodobacter capsulatus TaxID=1061 RepID=UPI0040266887
MPNTLAKNVLAEYLSTREPRYALLINAPWGAGKTEFVKTQTQYETDGKFLYLSLYGIDSAAAFNEALLSAIINKSGNEFEKKTRSLGEKLKNIASNSQFFGFSVNLSSISLVEGARKYLPQFLIFDDLERAAMPQSKISGLLNDFIEHDKRHVILIANTEKIEADERPTFDTTREKAIGRTIQIRPDVDAALRSYLKGVPAGRGKDYLQENQALIKAIFNQGKHKNLRLLRYAIQAAASLLDKVDEEIFKFEKPVEKLVCTFLALHMAYGGGRIGEEELAKRADSRAFGKIIDEQDGGNQKMRALIKLAEAHPDCDIGIPYGGSPLPVDLTRFLLVDGFASKDTINDQLRNTHYFSPKEDRPDWVKLWHWGELSTNELDDILCRITAQLSNSEISNPGEFIQIYGAMHWIACCGGLRQTQAELSEEFLQYISSLSAAGRIPLPLPPGNGRERFIFEHNNDYVSYGGYVFEVDQTSEKVIEALKSEMELKYNSDLADIASSLLSKFELESAHFLEQISYDFKSLNYGTAPILHLMDGARFSNRLLQLIKDDRDLAKKIANAIKSRRQDSYGSLSEEHAWIDTLKAEIRSRAAAESRLFGAQVDLFVRRDL